MIYQRHGNCTEEDCGIRTIEEREFVASASLFEPEGKSISWEIKDDLEKWRDTPIKCEKHREIVTV